MGWRDIKMQTRQFQFCEESFVDIIVKRTSYCQFSHSSLVSHGKRLLLQFVIEEVDDRRAMTELRWTSVSYIWLSDEITSHYSLVIACYRETTSSSKSQQFERNHNYKILKENYYYHCFSALIYKVRYFFVYFKFYFLF